MTVAWESLRSARAPGAFVQRRVLDFEDRAHDRELVALLEQELSIVIVTATDDPTRNRHARSARGQACALKPLRKEALQAAREAALACRRRGKSS